ncbi:ubiquitin-like modifier-activating enzyme 7 isoform X3 [Haemorhous mexicanus]|uniref:ubiquitin-like modifier-activating enzyme 7 isoform X3 n=1 Tax=Haemorhous mexicanus TaxID=30427 RepID=UPI0028BE04F6|nr:ubiquitin-like modifier-activating enzyme 7 isoform X3 [Haemorhous mexicanus]
MAGSEEDSRYSRQLYVLGGGARRLPGSAVLVSGLRGTGAQVATALVLAGTGRVVLHDCGAACTADRTHQFLLEESDLGQNRAKASQRALAELNPRVVVESHSGELSEAFLSSFQVVVLTESPLEEQLRIGDFCHAQGICFIVADTKGLAGQLFCDFGERFVVDDPAEGDPVSAAVEHISQGNPGVVTYMGTENSHGHLFHDGDVVTFSGVQGMTELNGQEPVPVRVLDTFRLEISDTSSFSPYRCGGLVSQVQQPQECSHKPLSQALEEPKIQVANPEDLPRSCSLHAAFRALHAFRRERGRLPRPRAPADAERVLELARSLGAQRDPLDEDIVHAFASVSAGDLCPVAAVVGALAAQEVLKAITGKFVPLEQWLYFDALECLALAGAAQLTETDCAPRGSRYDGQIAVFGANFQEKLGRQKYLVVGAGAIGCELLKNFAMMGLAAGPDGELIVTDMDTVALSNLHQQLLYRSADISEPKSVVAAAAVQHMNPDVRVTAHQNQVGPATETLYKDSFFRHLDGVASALDTMEARTYLERRCLRCRTPLLDSGTEGTQGNVMPMVPSLTEPLAPASTPRDGTFPMCTLRHFPRTIQHTLQWAHDEFEGLFQLPAEQVNQFMEDPAFLEQQLPGKVLEQVWESLRERPRDWQDCVCWARRRWQHCYHDAITQLLHIYPPEHETSPGVPFWAGDRSCPHPLIFNPDNDTHLDYVLAAAHLFAQVHGVPPCRDRAAIQAILRDVVLPPFAPQEGLQIPLTEEPTDEAQVPTDHRQLTELTQDLVQWRQELVGDEDTQAPLMEPIHFEKDDDVHIDFITAASNLRAENYGISPANWLTSKRIAGKIVPAIITTTAAVAGLACLEVYKLVWGCQDLSCYRNSNINLSTCLMLRVQPPPAPTYRYGGQEWSCWNRLEMRAVGADGQAMTVQEVLDWLQRTQGWTVTMLLCGDIVLYDSKADAETRAWQQAQRLSKSLEDARMLQQQDLELLYMCEGEDAEAEDIRPPLLCSLP